MEMKYYMGFNQVPYAEFQAEKEKAVAAGNVIESKSTVDGYPQYTLENGIVIRADRQGGFKRVEDGQLKEAWQVGTENEWIQGEQSDFGKADFFFKK